MSGIVDMSSSSAPPLFRFLPLPASLRYNPGVSSAFWIATRGLQTNPCNMLISVGQVDFVCCAARTHFHTWVLGRQHADKWRLSRFILQRRAYALPHVVPQCVRMVKLPNSFQLKNIPPVRAATLNKSRTFPISLLCSRYAW